MGALRSAAGMRGCRGVLSACLLLWASHTLAAQTALSDPPTTENPGVPMTLHVYAAHVQMPALVLTPSLQAMPLLGADRFNVRLDSGEPFVPSSVRLEGDDPLAVAVLLDLGGSQDRIASQLEPALVELRTVALRPQDGLMLFAVDCQTVRYSGLVPPTELAVKHALSIIRSNTALHNGSTVAVCARSLRLWDSMASMITTLAAQPARRVLLAFTDGLDTKSRVAWPALRSYAALHSVAIFAMSTPGVAERAGVTGTPLWNICALTGGLLMPLAQNKNMLEKVDSFVDLLRNRYIIEFPRANQLAGGSHTVDVNVSQTHAVVRLTGLSVPMLDKKVRDDPNTVPYLEAERPGVGGRRPHDPHAPER